MLHIRTVGTLMLLHPLKAPPLQHLEPKFLRLIYEKRSVGVPKVINFRSRFSAHSPLMACFLPNRMKKKLYLHVPTYSTYCTVKTVQYSTLHSANLLNYRKITFVSLAWFETCTRFWSSGFRGSHKTWNMTGWTVGRYSGKKREGKRVESLCIFAPSVLCCASIGGTYLKNNTIRCFFALVLGLLFVFSSQASPVWYSEPGLMFSDAVPSVMTTAVLFVSYFVLTVCHLTFCTGKIQYVRTPLLPLTCRYFLQTSFDAAIVGIFFFGGGEGGPKNTAWCCLWYYRAV